MNISTEEKESLVARVRQRLPAYTEGIDHRLCCVPSAALTTIELAKLGLRATFQAGSASWKFLAEHLDDGAMANSYSYVFDLRDEQSISAIVNRTLPEMHCWAAVIPNEIIDTTVGHLPELVAKSGYTWTRPPPPPFLWADTRAESWPIEARYEPTAQAITVAVTYLREGIPELYRELHIALFGKPPSTA